jgi:N-acylneuraminate cytidylyltransferase
MNKIAILPLRAGSKGIPEKNKKKILGRPLFSWVLSEALFSNLDQVYVYTDDKWILQFVRREYSWSKKIMILEREENDARDNASTEAAMMNFVKKINDDFDILCLLQATSPLTTRYDINKTLTKIIDERYDSAHTVVNTKRFTWNENGESLNYNYKKRPRRQDFKGLYIENGAVYATTKKQFMDS